MYIFECVCMYMCTCVCMCNPHSRGENPQVVLYLILYSSFRFLECGAVERTFILTSLSQLLLLAFTNQRSTFVTVNESILK